MLATTEENVLHLFTHTLTCCHYTLVLQDPVWLESAVNAGQLAHAQTINAPHITKKKKAGPDAKQNYPLHMTQPIPVVPR